MASKIDAFVSVSRTPNRSKQTVPQRGHRSITADLRRHAVPDAPTEKDAEQKRVKDDHRRSSNFLIRAVCPIKLIELQMHASPIKHTAIITMRTISPFPGR